MLTIFRFCENKSLSLQIKLVIAYVLTVTQVFRVLLFLKHALASLTAKLQLTAAHDMSRPINILRPDFERKNMELCELWLQALPSLPFPPPLSPYSVFLSPPPFFSLSFSACHAGYPFEYYLWPKLYPFNIPTYTVECGTTSYTCDSSPLCVCNSN